MTDRNAKYPLAGLVELDEAYFGGVSQSPGRSPKDGSGKRGRGIGQWPVVPGVSLNEKGHPQYAFLEVVEASKQETALEVRKQRVNVAGIGWSDGAAVYAAGAKALHVDHRVTLSRDPDADGVSLD